MSPTHVYVVTPYCGGGDLLKMVVPEVGTGEEQARHWFRQIFLGLAYVHSKVSQEHQAGGQSCGRPGDRNMILELDAFGPLVSRRTARSICPVVYPACACVVLPYRYLHDF